MTTAAIPEQGQLVEVRQRRYVVRDVLTSSLPSDPLVVGDASAQHLLTLNSVEDDALNEELQVVWEVEPGARVIERAELPRPESFDDPARFDAFLDAVRWGAVASADVRALQAPFRSGIAIEDYQLDPVARAIQMPRANLLIADDVGLGKTIEAGLVVQEFLLRHRAHTILVVCPSALQIQWRDQMRDKFGLEFRIVDSELMHQLRRQRGIHVNPWTHFPRLITSIDFLKRDRPLRLFTETLPPDGQPTYPRRFDLLIVDEAHNVAPSGSGRYATDSLRTAAIRRIVPHFEHKLFLSATPHNGYPESFTALLELLDNQRFARGVQPDPDQLRAVMVRRLKSEMKNWDGSARFPARELHALEVAYTEEELRVHCLLREYSESRQRVLIGGGDQSEQVATEFVLKLLKKRLFSSPAAFARTLEQHERSLETARKHTATHMPRASTGILRRQIEQVEEEFGDDIQAEMVTDDAMEATTRLFRPLTAHEQRLIDDMKSWAIRTRGRADSKARVLIDWLKRTLRPGGQWNDERVIIFTEYRDTQRWLMDILAAEGFTRDGRLLSLHGGMPPQEREQIKAAFQAGPDVSPVRILLATDAASEGIDLQNHCSRLIHVEIPWNPNRMEQRNGRIDRHGQKASEVHIYHFVAHGWRNPAVNDGSRADLASDLEFLYRAATKVNQIREDLGKVGPVIAQQVEEAMLGRRRQLDTSRAEGDSEPTRRMLKFERNLRERIEELRAQLQETREELGLRPEHVQSVVSIALDLAGQPPLQEANALGLWPDPTGRRKVCPVWYVPPLHSSWAGCTEGLAHPHTKQQRPIVFDHDLVDGRDDVVLAHLEHRLVQMALRLLRAEVWAPDGQRKLNRVTARIVPNDTLETPAVIAHARLLMLGGDHQRLHEEVIAAGGALREGRFSRLNVGETRRALEAALDQPIPQTMRQRLRELWPSHAQPLAQALETRVRDRSDSLRRFLAEREQQELKASETVLNELRSAILGALKQPEVQQLELFTTPEREQFERNMDTLQARAASIPDEIVREAAAIRARYADPQTRLFPVAVTYLVPERFTRGSK